MSITEMTRASSLISTWKILNLKKPKHLFDKIDINTENMMIQITEPRLLFTEQKLILRDSREWNRLPDYLRQNRKISNFKKQLNDLIVMERRSNREPD